MTERKPTGQRVEDTDWESSIGKSVIRLMPQFTPEAMIKIAREILAERARWRRALGVPQGLRIPEKPMSTTLQELEAELAEVTAREVEVTRECDGLLIPGACRPHRS